MKLSPTRNICISLFNLLSKVATETKLPDFDKRWTLFIFFLLFIGVNYSAKAQDSLVGGTLQENQVWSNTFTYIVYKDLRIPEGIKLTIEPGVTIKVNQGRGIYVLGGTLTIDGLTGEKIDSVDFIANHTDRAQDWKWNGISFTGCLGSTLNYLSYVNIIDAEIAVDIYNSEQIIIKNSSLLDNQNIGVRIFNSKNCLINDSHFHNNYDGIEIVASDGGETSGNKVKGCSLENLNHNIYLLNAFGGIFLNNSIENNYIEGGNNGIWADNAGGAAVGQNTILKNIFVNVGFDAGYGLLIAEDSIVVANNIFWKNRIAIYYDPSTKANTVKNNSFYQNHESVILSPGSDFNEFIHNTYSLNESTVLKIGETNTISFSNSNIFTENGQANCIISNTTEDIEFSNNFWYKASDSDVENLIWDHYDNPALGIVNFVPKLESADTSSPISPPLYPIKQLVNGQVKLSWISNPEADLSHYVIYFGNFEKYVFSNSEVAGKDTVFYLSGINIDDAIAVTAIDSSMKPNEAQVLGHESPFSFAKSFPFAGQDDIVCNNQTEYQINGCTVPFGYENINWTSNGDGFFGNPNVLNPVYFPGSGDKLNRGVELTMNVYSSGSSWFDSMTLFIYDDPLVFAGNDTSIIAGTELTITTAVAEYNQKVKWLSTGDGTFSNDTILKPIYTPGENDLLTGSAELVLVALSECGMAYDTLLLTLKPYYSLEGRIWYKNQPLQDAVIMAVLDRPEGARSIDLTHAGMDGSFSFGKLIEGEYYVYAVPDTLLSSGAVPGYYANHLRWQNAYHFTLDANTFDVDISLPTIDFTLPAGEGSISGMFELPVSNFVAEDIFCTSWFDREEALDFCDGGLSNITVFLYNSDATKLLDFTLTDQKGNFYFNKLPFGNYIIDAEKAGVQTEASSLITLSPEHISETGVLLKLGSNKIGIYRTDTYTENTYIGVYPNPVKNSLNIPFDANMTGKITLYIYTSLGQLIMQTESVVSSNENQTSIALDVGLLNEGIYFGKISSAKSVSLFRFVKN